MSRPGVATPASLERCDQDQTLLVDDLGCSFAAGSAEMAAGQVANERPTARFNWLATGPEDASGFWLTASTDRPDS